MKKGIVHCLTVFVSLLVIVLSAGAQNYADTKEKIYLQCSHVFFKPGETIYFKAYVVKGRDNKPTRTSGILYTEVLSPAGTVAQKMSYPVQDGYAEGSYVFGEEAPGGLYKIRAYTSWMQNETESRFFYKEIMVQKVIAPRVLMKLDFPEKGYGPGSEVKAIYSMRSTDDRPIAAYTCKYTVSVGGKEYSTGSFSTDAGGKAEISFRLPADLRVNDGLLNITVLYGGYTESVSRSIPIVLNKIDLQFLPEGGTLVNNVQSVIAFKALNEFGKATDVKGVIRDEKGNTITAFESYHFGMGRFELTPRSGHAYKAVIESPAGIREEYPLPVAEPSGFVMRMSKQQNRVELRITSTEAADIKLQASCHGVVCYLQRISLREGENYVSMDETLFPAGIAQFTLYDCDDRPVAERLLFLNQDRKLNVQLTTDKTTYGLREKVKLHISTSDENGKPIASNFSLAVLDDKLWTFADDKQDHILSWLLLGSELKGKVEEPQFYFRKEEPKALPALDLLMLTQGYRYFDYTEYVLKQNTLQFMPDQENILSGRILNGQGEPVAAKVYLVNTVKDGKGMDIITNADGYFFFTGLEPRSYYYVFAQALNNKLPVTIKILQNGVGSNPGALAGKRPEYAVPLAPRNVFPDQPVIPEVPLVRINKFKDPAPPAVERDRLAFAEMAQDKVMAQEVVVTAAGLNRRQKEIGYAVTTIRGDDIAGFGKLNNALEGRVAGLAVVNEANGKAGNAGEGRIILRGNRSVTGNGEPLIVLDGVPVANLNALNAADIAYVTVLRDASATTLFGSAAANGALLVETKKFRSESIRLGISGKYYFSSQSITTTGPVYTPVKKFYAPAYHTAFTEERTDFRETIYWNPVVQTGKDGTANVEFYNSDANTTFRVIAEGIGFNGEIGRAETTYAVQSLLQIDAKIPPYLTVGDKALTPLVIRNNSDREQTFSILVTPPANVITGNYDKTITMAAHSSQQVLVPVEATASAEGPLSYSVSGDLGKETIRLPFEAVDKGFPVKRTFSGNTASQNDFTIDKMIPGTLKANLKLYKNLEGQLLDGIESMLREPNGCFEQTSSSTYPNVFILKYLREAGKSNPEIEKKALGYIERGYKRLVGFETSQHGFEWFGNAPAHEALTAYGLLEFTDMQEFVSVDKQMLERTKNYLLGRRDGKGGFKLATGGYDRFAAVPNNIAGIYIVYALTQAGIGKEIQPEYEAALQQALKSKDGYQLAMMAIAAHTMKDMAMYNSLLNELSRLREKENLNAETSVVNSRDASLRVETNALYAIALLRAEKPELAKAADLISKILGEKSYYGYGSTQATVLALQAIVDYSRVAGRSNKDAPVYFTLNGKRIDDYEMAVRELKEGSNNFVADYEKADPNAVPYNFEVSYSTFTPPTSGKAELAMNISMDKATVKTGETVRMDIAVTNTKPGLQPMAIAKIGIPAGLSAQPWQLKEIMEKNKAAYYEIFDRYVVFYWMGFAGNETKTLSLDLKAEIPGTYKGKASTVYLYYTPEHKYWLDGKEVKVE